MSTLKRAKSLTDFFRPTPRTRPSSPSRHVPPSIVSPSTTSTLSPSTTAARPGDPFQHRGNYESESQQQRPTNGMHRSDTNDSGLDDILGAYGDSPVKSRTQNPTPPASSPTRYRNPQLPPPRAESMKRTGTDQSTASSSSGFDVLPTLDRRNDPSLSRSQGSSKTDRPSHPSRSKSGNSLDLIDRLDISGLYGGGGLMRHDGPYAAASTTRNQGTRAPIDAFDPSAFSLAAPKPSRQHSSNVSPRAAATLAAMESEGFSNDGPYGAAMGGAKSGSRTGGPGGEVSMGFPSAKASGKGQQLIEIYGVRDSEAWEDFGSTRYEPESHAASRESVVPAGVNKEDRMQRAQSIWDIEATLRAGKPVGQTAAPPPVPVLPSEWSQSSLSDTSPNPNSDNKPKRSKSLAARFRAGRKNPNNPILDEVNDSEGREAGLAHSQNGSRSQPTSPVEERRMQYPPQSSITQVQGQAISTPMGSSLSGGGQGGASQIKFDESASLEKRPSGVTRFAEQEDKRSDDGLGRRPSGLKRLFSKKGRK